MRKLLKRYHGYFLFFLSAILLTSVGVIFFMYGGSSTIVTRSIDIFTKPDSTSSTTPSEDIASSSSDVEIVPEKLFSYIEATDSCDHNFGGVCVLVRSGPGLQYPVVSRLRTGMLLLVSEKVEADGHIWYKIAFDEWLRYPERIVGDWYVAGDFVRVFSDVGIQSTSTRSIDSPTKHIIVDRSEQTLTALEDGDTYMDIKISTGLELTPTPRGTFMVFRKTPTRYMQGPLPNVSDQYYDLPGVPWNLYFTDGGAVIHGAYWHDSFGSAYSHGCVNLSPADAQKLYLWADLGTAVTVTD